MIESEEIWERVLPPVRMALALLPPSDPDGSDGSSTRPALRAAVARRDTAYLYDWLVREVAFQGISDGIALAYDRKHGGIRFDEVAAALATGDRCPRLKNVHSFQGCSYRKGQGTCAEPHRLAACPLPRHPLRKGSLNVAAYALFLFLRDVCANDVVGFLDEVLAESDPGIDGDHPQRGEAMAGLLLRQVSGVPGIGPKLWSMMLATLLLNGDPNRERWLCAGAHFVAIDTLVHAFLTRTGALRRLGADHPYGTGCYGSEGCASVIRAMSRRSDTQSIHPAFPKIFPRLLQSAIWHFCAVGEANICNGVQVNDDGPCQNVACPAWLNCDGIGLREGGRGVHQQKS